jgi:hypothetical protein
MPAKLLAQCVDARDRGSDFPTIYQTLIAGHPMIAGVPVHANDGKSTWIEIALRSGQKLIYRSAANDYALSR